MGLKNLAGWNFAASNRSARFILGKTATVKVVSTFRKSLPHKGLCYINCGYVLSAEADDSVKRKAFAVGVSGAVSEVTGEVICIIKADEGREYWIVAPKNAVFYEPELRFLVSGYLDDDVDPDTLSLVCFYEKSCGAVLFTEKDGKRYYILIKNMSGHVGFPKGHVEFGEDEHMTALREIYEETGVHARLIGGFRENYNYLINGYVHKEAVYFTAPFKAEDVRMNIMEISEYRLVTYDEAMKILNYPHDRNILRKAHDFISGYLAAKNEISIETAADTATGNQNG